MLRANLVEGLRFCTNAVAAAAGVSELHHLIESQSCGALAG